VRDRRLHTHTGMTPTGGLQNRLSWAGLRPPGLDEDDLTIMAMVTMMIAELDGTYEILDR
jgi:hypothetical protein